MSRKFGDFLCQPKLTVLLILFCFDLVKGLETTNRKHAFTALQQRPLYMRIRYAGVCENDPGDIAGNISISYVGPESIMNGHLTLLRSAESLHKTVVTIRRCVSQAEDKNCEYFQTWRFGKESCSLLEQKAQLWTPLFHRFHPQLKCPMAKGDYTIVNATLDASAMTTVFGAMLLEKYFWRVRVECYDEKRVGAICLGIAYLRGKH